MSRSNNEEALGSVVGRLLKAYGLEEGYYAAAIATHWEKLMGPMVARHTRELRLKKGVLTIAIDSAALRNELVYAREKIVPLINEAIGSSVVKSVELR